MKKILLVIALTIIPITAYADMSYMSYGNPVGAAIDSFTKLREVDRQEREFEHRKEMDEAREQAVSRQTAAEVDQAKMVSPEVQAYIDLKSNEAFTKYKFLLYLLEKKILTSESFTAAWKAVDGSLLETPVK